MWHGLKHCDMYHYAMLGEACLVGGFYGKMFKYMGSLLIYVVG